MTFNVSGDVLNGILNQRSNDMLTANNWIHVIADAHLYDRHIPIVQEVIANKPKKAPKLIIDPSVTDFYDFTVDSFRLENYEFTPLETKIPVAV